MASLISILPWLLLMFTDLVSGRLLNIAPYRGVILGKHNSYRFREPAANMRRLTWDSYLSARAARWSETCYFEHERRGLGENLSYFSSTGRAVAAGTVVRRSIDLWAAEKGIWRWSRSCGAACHYTQLIWARTARVGCSLSYCRSMRSGTGQVFGNAMYFVCFYSPPGNYIGQYPFIPGGRCSRCSRGDSCSRGMCTAGRRFGRGRRSTSAQEQFINAISNSAAIM